MLGIDWYYYLLFGFAVLWPILAKLFFGKSISLPEMFLNIVIVAVVIFAVLQIGRSASMRDYEVWNGQVTGTDRVQVSCTHSYKCRCWYDSDGDRHCSTCYKHDHDYAYMARSTIGDFRISNIDAQGLNIPPRWSSIQEGDPVSELHSYRNYIQGIGPSYFGAESLMAEFAQMLPEYPDDVYDYYHIDRVVTVNVTVPDLESWNNDLADILRHLGPQRQTNVVIVFVDTNNPDYELALQQHWLGGKKNDVVVVIGTPNFPEISWAGVFSLNENESFEPRLARQIVDLGTIDRTALIEIIDRQVMADYVRLPMETFEAFEQEVKPPMGAIIFAGLLCIFGSIGLSYVFHRNEVV